MAWPTPWDSLNRPYPAMIRRPSGLNARLRSGRSRLPGSVKRNCSSPVAASQMTRSEALPVAIQRPSGLKATPRKPLATFRWAKISGR